LGVIESHLAPTISLNALVENNASIVSIEYIDHIGGPSVFTLNGDSISVSNFKKGRNVLRFILTNTQGEKLNAFAFLRLLGGGIEVCEGGNCNLLSNSGFESLEPGNNCGVIDELQETAIGVPYVGIDCWSAVTASPDLHNENCNNSNYDFYWAGWQGGPVTEDPDPNNDNILYLLATLDDDEEDFEESISGRLAQSLVSGMQYEISMRVFKRGPGVPLLSIYFSEGEVVTTANAILDANAMGLISGPSEAITTTGEWIDWSGTFTVPMNESGLNHIVIANELVLPVSLLGPSRRRHMFIDNVVVRPVALPTLEFEISFDYCSSSCNAEIEVTPDNSNSFISWTGGLSGFNPTSVCPDTYTAVVTSPIGCSSDPVQIVIPSTSPLQTVVVNSAQTWSNSTVEYGNILLQSSNAFLTISNSTNVINGTINVTNGTRLYLAQTTLKFGPNGRIVVSPGGRLFIEQSTLTNNCDNQYWLGVEVQGSTAYNQADVVQSMSPNLAVAINNDGFINQGGVLIYKNSIVENADVGMKLHSEAWNTSNVNNSGGFIRAIESTFRNNKRDVTFSMIGNFNFTNQSEFRQCNFEVNNDHLNNGNGLLERVAIHRTNGVTFFGCNWINNSSIIVSPQTSQAIPNQAALRLASASCRIAPFLSGNSTFPSQFLGFIYGIRAHGAYLNVPFTIDGVIFRCYRGILASSSPNLVDIRNCDFGALNSAPSTISIAVPTIFAGNTTPWINSSLTGNPGTNMNAGPAYGVYLNAPGSTTIGQNNFSILGAINIQRIGLYVNGGGANFVNVRNNTFSRNTFGIRFFNSNRNSNDPTLNGTQFSCNRFSFNDLHVEINSNDVSLPNSGINRSILWSQNVSLSNTFDAYMSPITTLPVGRNIWDNVTTIHDYVGRPTEVASNTNRVRGFEIFPAPLTLTLDYTNNQPNPQCGASFFSTNLDVLLADFNTQKQLLDDYKDEGNPEYYQYLIESINSSNLVQRFNELSGVSPALTVDRIIEILDKESDLPRSMLMNILMSNVSSLKNGEALSKLDSLQIPLTTWEKDSLFTLFSIIDAKGLLEIQLNQSSYSVFNTLSEEVKLVLNDSLIIDKTVAVTDLNSKLSIITGGYSDLITAQNNFDYPSVVSLIDSRLPNIKESSMESKDLVKLKELIELTASYGNNDSLIQLNYDGFASNYLNNAFPLTYRMADLLVNKYDSLSFHGDLEYPYGLPSTRSNMKPHRNETSYEIKSFPNPASTYFQIQSHGEDINQCLLVVRDLTGREIPLDILTKSTNEWVIDVNDWVNGSYIIELRKEGNLIFTNHLIIER
jgi:hypothetical protein